MDRRPNINYGKKFLIGFFAEWGLYARTIADLVGVSVATVHRYKEVSLHDYRRGENRRAKQVIREGKSASHGKRRRSAA